MSAPIDTKGHANATGPGRFTRVRMQTAAGEIEARLSEMGNWDLRVRRGEEEGWRHACSGDLTSGAEVDIPWGRELGEDPITAGLLEIDPSSRQAYVRGVKVQLKRKEFELLFVLASQPDRVFSKPELFRAIWGDPYCVSTRTLESHASRLRTKLAAAGAGPTVINCWGVGYRLLDR